MLDLSNELQYHLRDVFLLNDQSGAWRCGSLVDKLVAGRGKAAPVLLSSHHLVTLTGAVMDVLTLLAGGWCRYRLIDVQAPGEGSGHHRVPAQGRDEGLGPNGGQDGDRRCYLLRQQTVPPQHPDPRADQETHRGAEPARCAFWTEQDGDQAALHLWVQLISSELPACVSCFLLTADPWFCSDCQWTVWILVWSSTGPHCLLC